MPTATPPSRTAAPLPRRAFLSSSTALALGAVLGRAADASPQGRRNAPDSGAWRIGCYTRPWAAHDYRVAFDAIAEAGYSGVGLMTTKGGSLLSLSTTPAQAATIRAEAKARGLGILSAWGGNFLVKPYVSVGVDGLRVLIDRCFECGCPSLLLGGTTKPELEKPYYESVAECCSYAVAKGVGLCVKPHGGTNATGAQCRKLIERVGQKNFGLWYDPGNIYYYSDGKLDPVDDSREVGDIVVGMSVKDFVPPKSVDLTPGSGKVDFPRVFANLRKGGFRGGPLVVECLAPGDLAKLKTEATAARRYLEGVLS